MAKISGAGMKQIILKLPYPPSNNRAHRYGSGHAYTPANVVKYKNAVKMIYELSPYKKIKFEKGEKIKATLFCNVETIARDLDNMPKVIFDAMHDAGAIYNDKYIFDMRAIKTVAGKNKGYVIAVFELLEGEPETWTD